MAKLENLTLKASEKISFVGSLATMLSAGIPILDIVNSLAEDTKGNQRRILDTLREDLVQGRHVYQSFSRFPRIFDKVTVNILKASEEAGTLDVTLKDLKENIRAEIEFTNKIKGALLYPVFVIFVFFAVLLLILIVVVPKISTVFMRLRVELPVATKILITMSNALIHNTAVTFGVILLIIGAGYLLYRQKRGLIYSIFFSLPLISGLVKLIDLTRFSRSMYLLLSSGIPINLALELAADVVNKKKTLQIIEYSKKMVLSGKKLSEGFRAGKGYVPAVTIKLIEAGERTGSLDKSMQDISEYFDYEVSQKIKTLTALLEPIMLVMVGVMVGGMMLAIIAPIYGLIGQVGTR